MDKGTSVLPIAVATSSGSSGVSPAVSMMDIPMPKATVKDDITVLTSPHQSKVEIVTIKTKPLTADQLLTQPVVSSKEINTRIISTNYNPVEESFRYFKNISASKTPLEVAAIQADYNRRQIQVFITQMSLASRRYYQFFMPMTSSSVKDNHWS